MLKRLKRPRKVRVNPWLVVTRIYADVKCRDCGFKGANHKRNFALEATHKRPYQARCYPCAAKRWKEKQAAKDLRIQLRIKEQLARRRKGTFKEVDADRIAQGKTRRYVVRRKLAKALRNV